MPKKVPPTSEPIIVHYLAGSQETTLCGKAKKENGSGPKWVIPGVGNSAQVVDCEICKTIYQTSKALK